MGTPLTTPRTSTLSASLPTDTGCALPPAPPSRSGTSRARTGSTSSTWGCLELPALTSPSACRWPGLLTVRLSSLDTPTTSSVFDRSLLLDLVKPPGCKTGRRQRPPPQRSFSCRHPTTDNHENPRTRLSENQRQPSLKNPRYCHFIEIH